MADIVIMPKLGFDMAEGTLIRWAKAEGEVVAKGELLAEIETDKATVEVESAYTGTVRKQLVGEGAIVPINNPIAVIGEAGEEIDFEALVAQAGGAGEAEPAAPASEAPVESTSLPDSQPVTAPAPTQGNGTLPDGVRASPLARRMAKENSIDLSTIKGSGPQGRITKTDIEAFQAAPPPVVASPDVPQPAIPALNPAALGAPPPDQNVPLSRLRQIIGRRMVQSKQEFPSFYVTSEYDLGAVMETRKQANAMLAGGGEKLSVNDFIVKATALALREFPNLNAALEGDHVVQFGQINIGVAVAVENGLMTVVTHDADRKSMRQISQEIKEKAGRAREGKVHPDDITGSTFSVSNLGMFDVDSFVAIISPPEAAILAIGSAYQAPVVVDGEVKVGWRMKVTISVDHRVSDGAEAAQFMQALGRYLENPVSLML